MWRFALVIVAGLLAGFFAVWQREPEVRSPPPKATVVMKLPLRPRAVSSRVEVGEPPGADHSDAVMPAPASSRSGSAELIYHRRDPEEWQGHRMDVTFQAPCESTATCRQARACVEGRCGPCFVDADCNRGEVCVMDHCVLEAQARCRGRKDCPDGEQCVLDFTGSNAFEDSRGNKFMLSVCTGQLSSRSQSPDDVDVPVWTGPVTFPMPESDLDNLERAFREEK